jgi:predicted phosphodiesterase
MTESIRIGIMADSHGEPYAIAAAVGMFKKRRCACIYHLGDICDSSRPETAGECVNILEANDVKAVRGNNDHAISVNNPSGIQGETAAYLSGLPLTAVFGPAVFAHSLPFAETLGLSCMIRGLGKDEAALFFKEHPGKILFRGHGHNPEIILNERGGTAARKLTPGESAELSGKLPCIVTCGSLAADYCMIWNAAEKTVECCLI